MSSTTTTRTSPRVLSSSLESTTDPGLLPPPAVEHKPSFTSSNGPSSRPVSRKGPKTRLQDRPTWSKVINYDGTPTAIRNDPPLKNPRSGGLRNTFRRLFGKKSPKDRISLPAPVGYPRHDPNEFITSAVDLAKQRSASVPGRTVLRTSALGSHSPFPVPLPAASPVAESIPQRPERSPPLRPIRPRRASLPSVILTAQESAEIGDQLPGLGFQDAPDAPDKSLDQGRIGFAVTSGSNPKRRSRSADDLREGPKEHRMSPIQWRQWRRRSDEIRYWRESADETAPDFVAPESRQPSPDHALVRRQGFVEQTPPMPQEEDHEIPPHPGHFNFGLSPGPMHSQENISLEERLVTLEIKLMDFEYAISKLQADIKSVDVKSPTEDISQHYEASPQLASNPTFLQPPPKQLIENSPTSNYDQSPESTPGMQQLPFGVHGPANQPKPRPTSIATTLKPVHGDRSSRNSMTELTIEHYTTLITLIRREQSARIRLEDQVTVLQQELRSMKSPSPNSLREIRDARRQNQYPSTASMPADRRYDSPDEHRRHYTPPERRPYSRDSNERYLVTQRQQQYHKHLDERSRSRSNYNDETDTDDEDFHEVYVTPVERGEMERPDLDGEEGLAF
ncbi:MAG: hypothetical protein Q9168_005912 [Polycauliona sp. 1 TL-2023]